MADPFSFDKDAQDGDVVTLENGVAYQYDAAKDRWLVKAVAGSGTGADWGFPLPEEQGNYVSKEGGDIMEGPLEIDGGRSPDAGGIVSTLKALNVDSAENSDLHLKFDGTTKVYVGKERVTLTDNLKFNKNGAKIVSSDDKEIIQINENGAFYDGNISAERHLVNKDYVDHADEHLQTKIDELEQELDVIAPRLEGASYTYVDAPTVKAGEMHIASGTFSAGTDMVFFNDVALDGNTHTWSTLNEGDYLEITDTKETRTAENYAMYLVTKAPEGSGMKQIEVALVKGQGAPTVGDVMDAKGFQLGGTDINELDERYALKSHSHDARDITSGTISMSRLPTGTSSTSVAVGNHSHDGVYAPDDHTHSEYALKEHTHEGAEGGYIVTPLVFPNLSGSQYASDDSIKSLNQYGSPTNGDFQGLDIPWLWFEKHYPDIIGWVDDGGDAKWGDQRGSLSVNKDSSNRPGLTISGNWSYNRVTVTIPGFVIHVDKMEEPQWGHKWPEKE